MTARNYDTILTVADATNFVPGNSIVGSTSATVGFIANVDVVSKQIKVKLNNVMQEFHNSETITSKSAVISGTANGSINTLSLPFQSNIFASLTTTATTTIASQAPSSFIAAKNAFTQNPIIRMYEVYYPGEWFPPDPNGNPTENGEGRAWPVDFPLRFADIAGDLVSDLNYNVTYGGTSFVPYPVDISSISQGTDGKINELTLTVFNVDNIISTLVENPYLLGNNISNSCIAYVNSAPVHGIDPRTINADPADVGSIGDVAFDTLTRARANGLAFSSTVVGTYGQANASFTKEQTEFVNGTWQIQKNDTRDLSGAVVNITTTFANFLDVWPEHSSVRYVSSNVIEVYNAMPYRVGDVVRSSKGSTSGTIQSIQENRFLFLNNPLEANTVVGDQIFIINAEADSESYIEDRFKIDQLESLNDVTGTFGLVSWLQYFKQVTPRRKYYKNTCQWKYKGEECQYPGPAGGTIPGTSLTANTNPIGVDNKTASGPEGDICGKNILACTLRNNSIHFGGFPATGRTIPKQ